MLKTSVFIGITARRQMPVAKSFSAALNVPPPQPAIKPVKTLKRNGALVWTKHLMSAMAALKKSIIVPLLINTHIMPDLLIVNIEKNFPIQEPV